MLVLSRHVGERILLEVGGCQVWVTLAEIDRNRVKLGFEAPRAVRILREELVGERDSEEARRGQG